MNSFNKKPFITTNPENLKKPFELHNDIEYISNEYNGKNYVIRIGKKYSWDGASIPRFFWRIVGSQYDPQFLPASCIHDYLCENKDIIEKHGVQVSSDIFRDILILYKVPAWKAKTMAAAVRAFQYTRKGWN